MLHAGYLDERGNYPEIPDSWYTSSPECLLTHELVYDSGARGRKPCSGQPEVEPSLVRTLLHLHRIETMERLYRYTPYPARASVKMRDKPPLRYTAQGLGKPGFFAT